MEIYPQPLYADGDSRITFTFTNIKLASEKNRIESKRTTGLCTHLIPRIQLGVFRLRAHACRSRECLTSLFLFFPFCSRLFFFVRSGNIHVLRLADQKPETFRRSWCVYPTLCLDFVRFWDTCLCWPLRSYDSLFIHSRLLTPRGTRHTLPPWTCIIG